MLPGALCAAEASGGATAALVHTLYGALLDGGDHPSPMAMAASCDTVNQAAGRDRPRSRSARWARCSIGRSGSS